MDVNLDLTSLHKVYAYLGVPVIANQVTNFTLEPR